MFPPLSVCTQHVLGRLQAKADVGVDHDLTNHTSPSPGLLPIQVPSEGSLAEVSAYGPERCVQGSRGTKRASGTPCHVPTASQPTPRVSAAHGLQHTTNTRNYLQLLDREPGRLISRAGSYFRAQCVVVAVHGLQTQNSVPEDGFNETTHHVLLHGLSPLPLPNRVHTQ